MESSFLYGTLATCLAGLVPLIVYALECRGKRKNTTLEKCEQFQRDVIPEYISLVRFHEQNKLEIIDGFHVYAIDKMKVVIKDLIETDEMVKNFLDRVMFLFNKMDAFAAFVNSRSVTNEELAFAIQGKAYCDIINDFKNLYDLYICIDPQGYSELKKLYDKWILKL